MRTWKLNLPLVAKLTTTLSVLLLVWYFIPQQSQQVVQTPHIEATKKILMWNKYYEKQHFGFDISRNVFEDNNCEVTDCQIWDANDGTADGISVEDFDLVWFHGKPLRAFWPGRPLARKPHQVYLFFNYEPPDFVADQYLHMRGFFNWSATYRSDSDIFMPYGWFINKTVASVFHFKPNRAPKFIYPRFDHITTQVTGKTKPIFWMVSNCNPPSNHDVYIDELSRHIPVDIYGNCGTPCTATDCDWDANVKTYKFYLSFEVAICKDYITEKLYRAMKDDVVPVVRGGGDYARHVPPHSYVDADDFDTPRELADHLRFLDNNDAQYRKYFWWKDFYQIVLSTDGDNMFVCELCALLHDPPPPKSFDPEQFWKADAQCVVKSVWLIRHMKRLYRMNRIAFVLISVGFIAGFILVVKLKNRWIPLARRMLSYRHL